MPHLQWKKGRPLIHTAKQSAKFTKLVRRIRSTMPGLPVDPSTVATGLLEQMWHFTISSAKRGDIGQHDDELIAEACGWLGEPADLVAMLVETGWLDQCDEHRLVVHDWHEHAPGFIKRNIDRAGGFVGVVKQALPYSPEHGSGRFLTQEPSEAVTPNQTKQNKTKPKSPPAAEDPELPEAIAGDKMLREAVEDWLSYKAERREPFKPRGLKAFYAEVANATARHGPVEVVRAMQTAMGNNWQGWTHGLGQESRAGPARSRARHVDITPI